MRKLQIKHSNIYNNMFVVFNCLLLYILSNILLHNIVLVLDKSLSINIHVLD